MESFFFDYLTSLANFWSGVFRFGLTQILIVVLVIWWLRRKRCGERGDDSCCNIWSFGTLGGCGGRRGPCCDNWHCCRDVGDEADPEADTEVEEAVADKD